MLLTLVGSSTRAMVHAAGSCSRRLLVFHTASNEEEKQSAKELKGAEHIEKRPRERERERREKREPKHFHPIISSNFIKTRLDRPPTAPNCNHNRATTQCTHCIRYLARFPVPVSLQLVQSRKPRCFF